MKGVILAGGLGTRLRPLTKITNKHLLPVFDRPMIFYPIQTLVEAGMSEIVIVTGGNNAGDFIRLIGNGKEFGLKHIHYTYQDGEGGIAAALKLVEPYVRGEKIVVMLGDNIVEGSIRSGVAAFRKQKQGAMVYLAEVDNPSAYGVPVFKNGKITRVEEKPKRPKSNYAVIGVYMYDPSVFEIIEKLRPSRRGELEISDVNNAYIRRRKLAYRLLDGLWLDAGESHDALLRANVLAAAKHRKSQVPDL
jgi:glucose-1-phosphate thymidylyltransferase